MQDNSYNAVMARKNQIMKAAVGMDYDDFESGSIAFDYEGMMAATGYTIDSVRKIQHDYNIGDTPLIELKNITALARACAPAGFGARIFVKDEAANLSGSFKVRRACTSIYHAKRMGYKGVIAATSGNYGAAVAACAAKAGLKCIVVQECFDSHGVGQPEIVEKARKCEALGAEVVQLTVGPELFYMFLRMLEDTEYFNASLYTPFGVAGVETLGWEIAQQFRARFDRDPDMVVATNAGGGNLTGTARGLLKAGCNAEVVAASVNLRGLHMASDTQFNLKSFTTGHTGFGMPFATWPDRSDVPRSAARPLRYMDRYVTVNQGEVFYITEALAVLEGMEKGPAGNTSLAAAFALAQQLPADKCIVVQETEYTGAGKHVNAQLSFARQNGIDIHFGDPETDVPGKNIVFPSHPSLIKARPADMEHLRASLIHHAVKTIDHAPTDEDIAFLAEETKTGADFVRNHLV
ncbi:MAG TPA: 2-amino-4-oxopentanoate thiolase subunit OrtB [Eubacteriales bacterium]|nr:2-amino-4-oxopentanoate thiolase subunit OrtB [Clostridia bacterium]HRV72262.1 2-amino-4-oxopentanoate thiolase subunit OrtB [Eubacteriales bacterium]